MPNLWFISDTHFNHTNILNFTRPNGEQMRPFASVQEMNEVMIENWNRVVRPSDHIYHLGDVSMMRPKYEVVSNILKRLNGHKRLVRGNHDIYKTKEYIEAGFEEIYGVRVIDNMIFTHIPIHPYSLGGFSANVHGHIHNNVEQMDPVMKIDKQQKVRWVPYINLSVEVINYTPVDLEWLRVKVRELSGKEKEG